MCSYDGMYLYHHILASAFDYLDAPVERVCGLDIPMPYSKPLEDISLPKTDNIINSVRRVL